VLPNEATHGPRVLVVFVGAFVFVVAFIALRCLLDPRHKGVFLLFCRTRYTKI
jgi:hypothetical protein